MKAPEFKQEVVVTRIDEPGRLKIETATKRASQRVIEDEGIFTTPSIFKQPDRELVVPNEIYITVNGCFDIDEVEVYLKRPFD